MKKISLKDVKNSLKRDEMRMILGGCGGSCCARPSGYETVCGLTKSDALGYLGNGSGNWCCASCGSSSWAG